MMRVRVEVLQLPAKECQCLLANHQKLGGGKEGFSSTDFRESMALVLDFHPPELREDKILLFKPPSVWYFVLS